MVINEGDGESDREDEAQDCRRQEEGAPRGAGFAAGATGAHGGAGVQQHFVEEVSEEEPLWNLAGGAHLRRGLRRLRGLARVKDAGGAGGRAVTGIFQDRKSTRLNS